MWISRYSTSTQMTTTYNKILKFGTPNAGPSVYVLCRCVCVCVWICMYVCTYFKKQVKWISGFRHSVNKVFALLGCYTEFLFIFMSIFFNLTTLPVSLMVGFSVMESVGWSMKRCPLNYRYCHAIFLEVLSKINEDISGNPFSCLYLQNLLITEQEC